MDIRTLARQYGVKPDQNSLCYVTLETIRSGTAIGHFEDLKFYITGINAEQPGTRVLVRATGFAQEEVEGVTVNSELETILNTTTALESKLNETL